MHVRHLKLKLTVIKIYCSTAYSIT